MTPQQLLGAAAALVIQRRISGEDGLARIVLHRLLPAQVGAICRAVLQDPELATRCCVRIPREVGRATGLPEEILTDEPTTELRNKTGFEGFRALLLANDDDMQAQSLQQLPRIGSPELLDDPKIWVEAAGEGLSEDIRRTWAAALRGLLARGSISLDRFAGYVSATRDAMESQGYPIERALGYALPALQLPRDQAYFSVIPLSGKGHMNVWLAAWKQCWRKRGGYLFKRHPTEQLIELGELRTNLQKMLADVSPAHQATFEAFVAAPPVWCEDVKRFAELEWETDNTRALFDGLRKKKQKMGVQTIDHFDSKFPEDLTEREREYLKNIDGRASRDADDDDTRFYEKYRSHLALDPRLKVAWDRFVFGRAIETSDLRVGLLRAVERLFEQVDSAPDGRTLTIECHRHNERQWQDVNKYAARYFGWRYRGLPALFGGNVQWKPESLFEDALVDGVAGKKADRTSHARIANQVKFTVGLCPRGGGDDDDTASVQVIWQFSPKSVLSAFGGDWSHVADNPFVALGVTRETVSAKGRLQSIDIRDALTLMPAGNQPRGSLVAHKDPKLDRQVREALAQCLANASLTPEGHSTIKDRWEVFSTAWRTAVEGYRAQSTASRAAAELGAPYAALLDALCEHASSDVARKSLWRPVAALGIAEVKEGDGASIIAPWHPLRLVAAAIADRRLGGLVRYLLREPRVEFGDARLFFRDMVAELERPFYPEVCVGVRAEEPVLLAQSDCLGDYSLMEPATRSSSGDEGVRDETHEDPAEAAKVLREVVSQFLTLYPHEAANLSVVLYNSDSVGLPEAAVKMLGEMHGEDDECSVRCHVQLRHEQHKKLQSLYESMLEASARDSESAVASEASRDFMARLRVGIMAGVPEGSRRDEVHSADIVFLQDVVARLCACDWTQQPEAMVAHEVITHVPSQWSRHRPSMPDDLQSITDLCCPMQTAVGWSYLRLVRGLTRHPPPVASERPLPIRRVSFDHGRARSTLEAAHRLGQWVVNYDSILTRQHLDKLNVRVIRHRRAADGERSVVVSSTAPLTMLHTLVRRNLSTLGLDLDSASLQALAERLISDAGEVSGDIVLRAARRVTFAHELIGVSLSRYLLADELGADDATTAHGWYFLDDYAEWLGQREGHIADLLALGIRRDDAGVASLVALVSEAKYVSAEILHTQRLHSGRQTEETLARMQSALFDTPQRLDRDQWLARLADLLGHGRIGKGISRANLQSAQRDIAAGRMKILLRGYSHVFVYQQSPDLEVTSARAPLSRVEHGWQETFAPDAVRQLLRAYHRGESPRLLRAGLGSSSPWAEGAPQATAEGANWATTLATTDFESPLKPSGKPPGTPPAPPTTSPPSAPVRRGRPPALATSVPPQAAPPTLPAAPEVSPVAWAAPRVAALLAAAAPDAAESNEDLAWLDDVADKLASALRSYKHQAKLLDKRLTPNAALVRFAGSDLLTVKDVEARQSAMLTTHALEVLRVEGELGAVVISVARPRREVVSLPSVLLRREVLGGTAHFNSRLVLGVRERDGSLLYLDPMAKDAPHTLIAGTSGSGKSVLLQNLILDIAMTNTPEAATITLIDPKLGVDYFALRSLPHLGGSVVVEQDAAIACLEALVEEMEMRYRLFAEVGAKDLAMYNAKVTAGRREPVRWLVHDEFADWMMVDEYKSAVTKVVGRLGVKARAAGIHLIFAAQRPEERVMPMQLRSNLDNRLVLKVADIGTSKIALNEEGAERLLGKGQMIAKLQSERAPVLAQVPILSSELMERLVAAIVADASP